MLQAQDTQFRLSEDGQISFQKQASNPLPGEPIAMLTKGAAILTPKIVMLEHDILKDVDRAALFDHLQGWLARHIASVLEPLVALGQVDAYKPSVKGIAFQVHEALGLVPREGLESLIADLDADDRRDLRTLKIRLGPILVFIPALNKPAAVRLRALLWGLYHEKELPLECPKDGIVSFAVDESAIDKAFYQAIAYPVFGGRAIRIDMLDRVISAVYDAAEGGKFKADHKMAEWLGSSIDGLYKILEAMGHTKVYDPAEVEVKAETSEIVAVAVAEDVATEEPKVEDAKPADVVKPELATFRLKKGKAFEKPQAKKPFIPRAKPQEKSKDKDEKPAKAYKGKRNKATHSSPKIMSTGPEKKLEDSPFAILEQLKKSHDKA